MAYLRCLLPAAFIMLRHYYLHIFAIRVRLNEMNVAIIDSNRLQAEKLANTLSAVEHKCFVFNQEDSFWSWLSSAQCDLLLINSSVNDAFLQDILVRKQEQYAEGFPLLLLMESHDSERIVSLLNAGLDDYCVLPEMSTAELVLRVQVLLRRAWPDRTDALQLTMGPFVFYQLDMAVEIDGRKIQLTQKEYELALFFFQHLGQPLSRATILDAVWGLGADVDPDFRSIDTHVARIRRKLSLRAETGFHLTSVYGYGYVLEQLDKSQS